MSNQTLEIPQQADRCVVLIAHPPTNRNGDLTEEDRKTAKQVKGGNTELIGALINRFGKPSVHCGQSNVSIMSAVTTSMQAQIVPMQELDAADSRRQTRKRARHLMFGASACKPLTIAYSDHGIVNKALGAKNHKAKTGIKPLTEAAVFFLDKQGRVIGLHRQDLLMQTAA